MCISSLDIYFFKMDFTYKVMIFILNHIITYEKQQGYLC